jgi:hypothetical protein
MFLMRVIVESILGDWKFLLDGEFPLNIPNSFDVELDLHTRGFEADQLQERNL